VQLARRECAEVIANAIAGGGNQRKEDSEHSALRLAGHENRGQDDKQRCNDPIHD
jgi:hypothetical protein